MENIKLILSSFLKGIVDSIFGVFVLCKWRNQRDEPIDANQSPKERSRRKKKSPDENPAMWYRIAQCCALNGFAVWLSIIAFNYAICPAFRMAINFAQGADTSSSSLTWDWMSTCLSMLFSTLWVIPLFSLSKLVNSFWFQDIAELAFRNVGGRRHNISSISKQIADFLFSLVVQTLFLAQAMALNLLPIKPLGQLFSLFHMSLLYSLYAFEYRWCNMGWELHKRLSFIENNWPYFTGFGLPLAWVTNLSPSFVISGCIFAILFPLLIISANQAEPVLNPVHCPVRLFSPVVFLSNVIFQKTMSSRRS